MSARRIIALALGVSTVVAVIRPTVPQFIYSADTAKVRHESGCSISSWDGTDPFGMVGPPWVSFVNCSDGSHYSSRGVNIYGDFQVWSLVGGRLRGATGGEVFNTSKPGESIWFADGTWVDLRVSGAAYIVGAKFELHPEEEPAIFTSAYLAPKARSYLLNDAVQNLGSAELGHDDHIANGSSPSKDFVFGTRSGVDPASVVVLNCVNSSEPDKNFVWSHFHAYGAVYLPLQGEICFSTDKEICVEVGTARWTSPNLQYYEHFRKSDRSTPAIDGVREMAGVAKADCEIPILFAVTNFDIRSKAGVPNFDDWPVSAHKNKLALGIGPWGIFPRMALQGMRTMVGRVDVHDEVRMLV